MKASARLRLKTNHEVLEDIWTTKCFITASKLALTAPLRVKAAHLLAYAKRTSEPWHAALNSTEIALTFVL
jgi:predicted nucleic acid-binding protein